MSPTGATTLTETRLRGRGGVLAGMGVLLLASSLAAMPPVGAAALCDPALPAELGLPAEREAQARLVLPDLALLPPEDAGEPSPASLDPSPSRCEGRIRPGARLIVGETHACTANWVFSDSHGALYLGTAGHCVPTLAWTSVVLPGVGDIGDPVFTTGDAGPGADFALIRILPALRDLVEPTMCRWGGPSDGPGAPQGGAAEAGGDVRLYGWGSLYQAAPETRARWGALAPDALAPEGALAYLAPTSPGDSGGPILGPGGAALGLHTHSSAVAGAPVAGVGLKFGTALPRAQDLAGQALGWRPVLVPGEPAAPPLGPWLGEAPATTP